MARSCESSTGTRHSGPAKDALGPARARARGRRQRHRGKRPSPATGQPCSTTVGLSRRHLRPPLEKGPHVHRTTRDRHGVPADRQFSAHAPAPSAAAGQDGRGRRVRGGRLQRHDHPAPLLAAGASGIDNGAALVAIASTHRSVHPEMSDAAANQAAEQSDERRLLYDELTKNGGPTYGGAWFDPPSGVLHVAVTTTQAEERVSGRGRELGLDVKTHLVRRTFAELERQADALRASDEPLGRAADGQVGIDVETNQVVAAVPAEQRSALAPSGRAAGVRVVSDPELDVRDDACTARNACDSEIRAGATIWRGSVAEQLVLGGLHRPRPIRQPLPHDGGSLLERQRRQLGYRRAVDRPDVEFIRRRQHRHGADLGDQSPLHQRPRRRSLQNERRRRRGAHGVIHRERRNRLPRGQLHQPPPTRSTIAARSRPTATGRTRARSTSTARTRAAATAAAAGTGWRTASGPHTASTAAATRPATAPGPTTTRGSPRSRSPTSSIPSSWSRRSDGSARGRRPAGARALPSLRTRLQRGHRGASGSSIVTLMWTSTTLAQSMELTIWLPGKSGSSRTTSRRSGGNAPMYPSRCQESPRCHGPH